jgi:hypothetical protein
MSVADQRQKEMFTEHALLVPLGHFAEQIGLLDAFDSLPVEMKAIRHTPGEKVAELLVGILAGNMHVRELEDAPHPVTRDPSVALAWGQETFACAAGVNDLLRAVSPATVDRLREVCRRILTPYRQRLLGQLSPGRWVVDGDLTGLVVSDQAQTYAEADYGYMGVAHGLAKGYQFARVQVQGKTDALLLGGCLYPGHTISQMCLAQLVATIEADLGRPRRRIEALDQRLAAAEQALATAEAGLTRLATDPPRAAKRRQDLETWRQRAQAEVTRLRARREALLADNATLSSPRQIILRLDGGFGTADLLAWLWEMGYDFVVRAANQKVAESLRAEGDLVWDKVSQNGFIAPSTRSRVGTNPYALRIFACREARRGDHPERWSALLVSPSLPHADWPARRVGVFYNGRQAIEATIKEGKGIFASRHLPTRHQPGIAFFEELVLLAQNLLRWFRRAVLGNTVLARASIHDLVRLGTQSRARISSLMSQRVLTFGPDSPWCQTVLVLTRLFTYQLVFPFIIAEPSEAVPP